MDNKYCVYTHEDSSGMVRYVGSGTIARANTLHARSSRGKLYEDFVNTNGKLNLKVHFVELTKSKSLLIERQVFESMDRDLLLNFSTPSPTKPYPSFDKLHSLFRIDEKSPSGLTWVIKRPRGVQPNDAAGTLTKSGYYSVGIDSKLYLCHRIIMIMLGFDIAEKVIDHLNRQRSDNSIVNLRITDQSTNMQNRAILSNNSSGITGVRFCSTTNKWLAQLRINNQRHTKSFSVDKYGHEAAKCMAISARNNLERCTKNESISS